MNWFWYWEILAAFTWAHLFFLQCSYIRCLVTPAVSRSGCCTAAARTGYWMRWRKTTSWRSPKRFTCKIGSSLICSSWFSSAVCWYNVLCTDGDRQRRRSDRRIPVWGGLPNGAHPKAGLLQAPRARREEGQQTHRQGGRREWRGELDAMHQDAHQKEIKLSHMRGFVSWLFRFLLFMFLPAALSFTQREARTQQSFFDFCLWNDWNLTNWQNLDYRHIKFTISWCLPENR